MLQAVDVITSAREEGQSDPYILLGRLKATCGIPDSRAREILRREGFEIADGIVDPRFDVVSNSRRSCGFVRN
jgi:hypothetical protein